MKKLLNLFGILCPIGAAVILYICISEIFSEGENILLWVLAAVFSLGISVLLWAVGAIYDKVTNLEDSLGIYVDKGYEPEEIEKKECPVCHSEIDLDYVICPFCENKEFDRRSYGDNPYGDSLYRKDIKENESFPTDDPDYNGTDYSDEEVVSCHGDSDDE